MIGGIGTYSIIIVEKIEKKNMKKKYSIVIGEPNLPSMYLTQIS